MTVERSFIVKLFADTSALEKAFGETGRIANDAFTDANKRINELVPGFQKIALASAAAFAGLAAFASGAAKAAIEDEAEQAKLAKTLENVVGATGDAVAETENFIKAQSRLTGFTDSELRPSIESLVRATGNLAEAEKQVVLAQNIAAATGAPLVEVSNALARANVDNFKSLVALVPALRDNVKEGQSLDQVFAELNNTFSGAAAAAAQTTAGRMKILQNSVSEAREAIGAGLIPAISAAVGPLTKLAQLIEDNATIFSAVVITVLTFTGTMTVLGLAMKGYAVAAGLAAVATRLLGTTISASGIGGFVLAMSALVSVTVLAANALFKAEKATKQLQAAVAGADGIVRVAGNSYVYLTGKVLLLNSSLSRTVNVLATQSNRLEALARSYGVTTFKTGQFDEKTGGASKTVMTAKEKIAEYTSVLKRAQGASDAFGAAQKRVGSAQLSVADANDALKQAQDALAKAQQGGTAQDIAAAQRAVAAAERGVARSKFSHEEAIIAVRDAERELAAIRQDPESTADDIRKAEIALAEAKFNVADSEDRQIETANGLAEARRNLRIATDGLREGDEELLPLQKAVEAAQRQQTIANDELTASIKAQSSALEDYTTALAELAEAAKKFPRIASNRPAEGLIPAVPAAVTPQPFATAGGVAVGNNAPVNIIVQSGVLNGAQVGEEIYQYLRDYERVNGPLNLMV
jgi:uncharacterized membrane protein (DUF485 family)